MLTKRRNKIIICIIIALFIIICSIVFVFFYVFSNFKLTDKFLNGEICDDNVATPCDFVTFEVEEGSYDKDTLNKLSEEGILYDSNIAYLWNKFFGNYTFYAGRYKLYNNHDGQKASLEDILNTISNPVISVDSNSTIKLEEGSFASDFAKSISENVNLEEVADDDDVQKKYLTLITYWNNENVVRKYMQDYPFLTEEMFDSNVKILLEGYLFPDTYNFYAKTNCDEITRKLLDRTLEIYNKYKDDFNNSKLSIHQVFTLASIVQWETGDPEDSLLVSGVFMNRIENPENEYTGGKLQSTVTACYAFSLTKDECNKYGDSETITKFEHPYNTYTIEGFPPGPVCCPSEISINAALHPNQEDGYYFFVANMCDGGTIFSKTYDEHNNNINLYYIPCADD